MISPVGLKRSERYVFLDFFFRRFFQMRDKDLSRRDPSRDISARDIPSKSSFRERERGEEQKRAWWYPLSVRSFSARLFCVALLSGQSPSFLSFRSGEEARCACYPSPRATFFSSRGEEEEEKITKKVYIKKMLTFSPSLSLSLLFVRDNNRLKKNSARKSTTRKT